MNKATQSHNVLFSKPSLLGKGNCSTICHQILIYEESDFISVVCDKYSFMHPQVIIAYKGRQDFMKSSSQYLLLVFWTFGYSQFLHGLTGINSMAINAVILVLRIR